MLQFLSTHVRRSAIAVILTLTLAAVAAFAAVSHLVTRFNLNQQARGRKLYAEGLANIAVHQLNLAIEEFRAALTCDPDNSQYQLSLGRALRDTGRLDEAESYLQSLWERTPEDGTINLALARVAARRGSLDDATRYYHNAMYGLWTVDADTNRRKARIELIEFLLQKNAVDQARSEILALAAFLPPDSDPALRIEVAQFLTLAHDYPNALAEYEKVLHVEHTNAVALAGGGNAAFRAGRYRTAQRYLQAAVAVNPLDSNSHNLLLAANAVLEADPFVRGISDAERNRRIVADYTKAGERLMSCAQVQGVNLATASLPSSTSPLASAPASPLVAFHDRWLAIRRDLPRLRSIAETDLPDTIMDVVFQIEQQTANICGEPQGVDQALLLISRDREGADQ